MTHREGDAVKDTIFRCQRIRKLDVVKGNRLVVVCRTVFRILFCLLDHWFEAEKPEVVVPSRISLCEACYGVSWNELTSHRIGPLVILLEKLKI